MREQQEEDEPPVPSTKRFDARISLAIEADDNILHLRDEAIQQFESGLYSPDKYLIQSVDDLIMIPSVDIAFSSTPESRKRSRLRLTANAYRYLDNSIKNYEWYRLRFEQDLSDVRPDFEDLELTKEDLISTRFRIRRAFMLANRSRLYLGYTHSPERYVSQLTDDDGGGRQSAYVIGDTWSARYYQRLNRGEENRWRLTLAYSYDELDYNQYFNERDSTRDRFQIGANLFHLAEDAYWLLGLDYEWAERESNTALIGRRGPAGTVQDDLSYDGTAIDISLGRYWYREMAGRALYKSSNIRLRVTYGEKDYTTNNLNDLSHYLRDDDYFDLAVSFTRPFNNKLTGIVYAEWTEQSTTLDPIIGLVRLEPSDFDNFVFGVQVSAYFSRKSETR